MSDSQFFVLEPARMNDAHDWVWYAPTRFGSTGLQQPTSANRWLFDRLLDAGFHVSGVDVGESFGNAAGVSAFSEFFGHMTMTMGCSRTPSLLAQSRGALMLYNWAIANPSSVRSIAGIFPVVDLMTWPPPGDQHFSAAANAYGLTIKQYEDSRRQLSPINRLEPLATAGVSIFHVHGTKDRWVPHMQNSVELRSRYIALGGKADIELIEGKGHDEQGVELYQSARLLTNLIRGRLDTV